MTEHRSASSTKTNLPLYRHFKQRTDHILFERDVRVTILQITTNDLLLEMEDKWIKAIDSLHPKGLNGTFYE